jgi:thiamine kinase-like enzyme
MLILRLDKIFCSFFSQLVARKLAEFHSISSKITDGPQFVDKLKSYIELFTKKNIALQDRLVEIKEEYEEAFKNDTSFLTTLKFAVGLNTAPTLPLTLDQLELQLKDTSWAQLSTEIDFIRTIFQTNWSTHGLPMVLCLNDLNIHNFKFDSKNQLISIFDFDHCSSNYNLIDIVSFFLELAKDDYETKYPDRRVQKLFLTEYLKYSSLNLSTIVFDRLIPTDRELEKVCDLCGLLIAPIHLYWALWAFLQALLTKPTPTFDYINYGKIRLEQYRKHKDNFFLPLYPSQKNLHEH